MSTEKSSILQRFVRIGISEDMNSLTDIKSMLILARIVYVSIGTLAIYICFSFLIGFYTHAYLSMMGLPLFVSILMAIVRKKGDLARKLYAFTVFMLIGSFSILFGKGVGSEYWILILGGLSLLIFRERKTSFWIIVFSIVFFFTITILQAYISPYFNIPIEQKEQVFPLNILFISLTFLLISFILRFSAVTFETEVQKRNEILGRKNKSLLDGIHYAGRIQKAVLPPLSVLREYSKNIFVISRAKDIVSGDFHWIREVDEKLLFAVVDGSGHGVPGALNSIMSYTMLSQCVDEHNLTDVKGIVENMRNLIEVRMEKWNDVMANHIQLSVCCFDRANNMLSYASSGNAIYLIKHVDNVLEGEGFDLNTSDRYAMRVIRSKSRFRPSLFTESKITYGSLTMSKDDMIYLLTDGMANQFGGPNARKFTFRRMRDLLMSVHHLSLDKQRYILNDVLKSWQGRMPSTDDLTVLGFKL